MDGWSPPLAERFKQCTPVQPLLIGKKKNKKINKGCPFISEVIKQCLLISRRISCAAKQTNGPPAPPAPARSSRPMPEPSVALVNVGVLCVILSGDFSANCVELAGKLVGERKQPSAKHNRAGERHESSKDKAATAVKREEFGGVGGGLGWQHPTPYSTHQINPWYT